MRIATWNVNSIRTRVDRVVDWLGRTGTDVLAMQEIKCKPEQFPTAAFHAAGYEVAILGHNQWNGVAIASRVGISDVQEQLPGQPAFGKPGQTAVVEARALRATCAGVDVWSVYVPNGRGLDDPHYEYKLEFLRCLANEMSQDLERPVLAGGDYNVAPLPEDIWSETEPTVLTHVSAATRAEISRYTELGLEEISRKFVPEPHSYTYWDYQQLRFPRNEGMRIDFWYGTPSIARRAIGGFIDREERKGKGASDHVPVVIDLT